VITRCRDHYFSTEIPIEYNSGISLDNLFTELLNKIFLNDANLIEDFQKQCGLFLSGANARSFFIWHGNGKNGKSLLKILLGEVIGEFFTILNKAVFIDTGVKVAGSAHTSHLVPLKGLRLGITDEINADDKINTTMIKQIAGLDGDKIPIRGAYQRKETKLELVVKGVLCLNDMPEFNGADQAIVDRLVCFPFNARFIDKPTKSNEFKADSNLPEKIKRQKYLAKEFLAWAVQGAMKGYRDGFTFKSEAVRMKTKNSVLAEDPVQQFIDEYIDVVELGFVKAADFTNEYHQFLLEIGCKEKLPNAATIGKTLVRKGFNATRINKIRGYSGMRLKQNVENNMMQEEILEDI
jgi:putative DNA primase/helicase